MPTRPATSARCAAPSSPGRRLCWADVYSEAELHKAALGVYTKSLFQRHKALSTSLDGRTLFDFARRGLANLDAIHRSLAAGRFSFRPGAARTYNLNGKMRTFYLYPWAERVVDLLLYRLLNVHLDAHFSGASYAYRRAGFGVDRCQARIARGLARLSARHGAAFVVKRDIARYFDSIDHDLLLAKLAGLVDRDDFLWRLLVERIHFPFEVDGRVVHATRGVAFGTPVACVLANLYLTDLDRRLEAIEGLLYFRYADDLLGFAADAAVAARAAETMDQALAELRLEAKPSHSIETRLAPAAGAGATTDKLRHLGLEFRADGCTRLSRDKARKIRNLFRFAFRRNAAALRRAASPEKRARIAARIARRTLESTVRSVAIVDYYLRHVRDEAQLRLLDRWLAEEVLSIAFGNGHRKGNFGRIGFAELRRMGLPSLRHRSRLIRHREIESPFFRWKESQQAKRRRGGWRQAEEAFSPCLEAAVEQTS